MDELETREFLYDRSGMNFFTHEVDGQWYAGWFRIVGGRLEVCAENECRSAAIDADQPEFMSQLLRKLLADIVHEKRGLPINPPQPLRIQ